jgi:hypothetical protein
MRRTLRLSGPAAICEPAAVTLLAAKVLLSPLCVIAVSLAGRRWGVAVAGVLGGLPVVAGPILLVETLLHGRDFGADAAAGTLLGLAALTAFVVVYGRVATRSPSWTRSNHPRRSRLPSSPPASRSACGCCPRRPGRRRPPLRRLGGTCRPAPSLRSGWCSR